MNVTVHCPDCRSVLEVPQEHLGREVECGICNRPFVARMSDRPAEPEVILTTPIDDDDGSPPRRRGRPVSVGDVTAIGWGICSLVIGMLGILMLPVSLCCSVGVLGCIVSGLGLLCGLAGLFLNPVRESRGIAMTGVILNFTLFAICSTVFLSVVLN